MSNTRLLIADGSNVVMRCALGGELSSAQAVPTASNMIGVATRQLTIAPGQWILFTPCGSRKFKN